MVLEVGDNSKVAYHYCARIVRGFSALAFRIRSLVVLVGLSVGLLAKNRTSAMLLYSATQFHWLEFNSFNTVYTVASVEVHKGRSCDDRRTRTTDRWSTSLWPSSGHELDCSRPQDLYIRRPATGVLDTG